VGTSSYIPPFDSLNQRSKAWEKSARQTGVWLKALLHIFYLFFYKTDQKTPRLLSLGMNGRPERCQRQLAERRQLPYAVPENRGL